MKLYHGTNADIDAIDLNRGMLHKDFGKGFYLTSVSVLPIFLRLRARRGFSAGHWPVPCTALGLDVNIWTPDTEEQMRMTKIRRPDFITKDNPVGKW